MPICLLLFDQPVIAEAASVPYYFTCTVVSCVHCALPVYNLSIAI